MLLPEQRKQSRLQQRALAQSGLSIKRRQRPQPDQSLEFDGLGFATVEKIGGGFVVCIQARPGVLIVKPEPPGLRTKRSAGNGLIVTGAGLAHDATRLPRRASRRRSFSLAVMRLSGTPSAAWQKSN